MIEINKNKTKSIRRIILAAVCAVLALIFIIGSVSIVPEGYTGNTYRFGELVNTDADAAKLKADADAYAIQVMQEQLQNSPQYVELIKAQKWDGVLPQVMGNTVNPLHISQRVFGLNTQISSPIYN